MTDQDIELLMAAGAAAGLDVGVVHQRPHRRCAEGWTPWNPLEDDGDALRLAVKLRMLVDYIHRNQAHMPKHVVAVCCTAYTRRAAYEPFAADMAAVTRRAIVRAAAALAPNGFAS